MIRTDTPVLVQVIDDTWAEIHNLATGELVSARPLPRTLEEVFADIARDSDPEIVIPAEIVPTDADRARARQIFEDMLAEAEDMAELAELEADAAAEYELDRAEDAHFDARMGW